MKERPGPMVGFSVDLAGLSSDQRRVYMHERDVQTDFH
jgi:hypothetical protein